MYVTAHRVRRGNASGINTFLHLHGDAGHRVDWRHPDVSFVADECPGHFVVQRTEVPPGNNSVSSYLDVVASDDIDNTRLILSLGRTQPSGSAGDVWYDGEIGYRFYCSTRHSSYAEFELLRAHVGLMLHDARQRFHALPATNPLIIDITNDDTGIRYELEDASRRRLLESFPDRTPATIGVFFEYRNSLIGLWGEHTYHFEMAKAVTQLSESELSGLGGVVFRDQSNQLMSPGVASRRDSQALPGQLDGYWYGPGEEVPMHAPAWAPTGALLVRGNLALVLVPIEFHWVPMSDAAIYTYRHTLGLQNHETWTFLTDEGATFNVRMADPLLHLQDMERVYGPEAASRAGRDRPAVQVSLEAKAPPR